MGGGVGGGGGERWEKMEKKKMYLLLSRFEENFVPHESNLNKTAFKFFSFPPWCLIKKKEEEGGEDSSSLQPPLSLLFHAKFTFRGSQLYFFSFFWNATHSIKWNKGFASRQTRYRDRLLVTRFGDPLFLGRDPPSWELLLQTMKGGEGEGEAGGEREDRGFAKSWLGKNPLRDDCALIDCT